MIKTDELFAEAVLLPLDMRAQLVDKLQRSLHSTQNEIDELWAKEAERRVEAARSGKVATIPGHEVFEKIRKRLGA